MKMRSQNLIRSKELELIKAPQRTPKRKHTIAESRAEKNKCKRIITIYQSNSNHSMAITTSGSIDIYGSAACDQEKVSRAMPAILSGRITSDDWSVLCNDLDEALKPSSGVKKLIHAWNAIVPLVFLIFLIFGFLGFASASADKKGFNWSSLIVAVLIAVLGNLCVLFLKLVQKNKIQKKLVAVCEKTSTSHPGISFHVRYQMRTGQQNSCDSSDNDDCRDCNSERRRDHIEVCVAPVATSNAFYTSSLPPVAVAEAFVVPSTFAASASTTTSTPSAPPKSAVIYPYDDPEMPIVKKKKTAEERMRDLDHMRHIITEEEYYRKRAEILSDI
jgi:hypothetical protein